MITHYLVGRDQIQAEGRAHGRGCEREQVARHIQVHLHDLVSETPLSRFFKKERGLIAERWFRTKLVSECL